MRQLNFFAVSYDRFEDKAIQNLTDDELSLVKCYAVQKSVPKRITNKVDVINEWELNWNDYSYQSKQYYEYGAIVHLIKNPEIIKGLTHVGLLHYDVLFGSNSVNKILDDIESNPNQIFYQMYRSKSHLYLSRYELSMICRFMSKKLQMRIDPNFIWGNGWISEALSVTPVHVFEKFGNFILENRSEIENLLIKNKWGLMNFFDHKVCSIVERMWGIYLVSYGYPIVFMDIKHDWSSYVHKHHNEKNWIMKNEKRFGRLRRRLGVILKWLSLQFF